MSVRMRSQFDQRDEYGFLRPEDFDYAEYEEFMSSYLGVLAARRQKWDNMVRHGYHNISKVKILKAICHNIMIFSCSVLIDS